MREMNFVRIIIRRVISFAVLNSTLRGNHRLHPPVWRLASGQGRGEAPRFAPATTLPCGKRIPGHSIPRPTPNARMAVRFRIKHSISLAFRVPWPRQNRSASLRTYGCSTAIDDHVMRRWVRCRSNLGRAKTCAIGLTALRAARCTRHSTSQCLDTFPAPTARVGSGHFTESPNAIVDDGLQDSGALRYHRFHRRR